MNTMNENTKVALQAEVLTAALPYIQKYTGKVVVIKYGGNAMLNPELKKAVMSDIVLLSLVGVRVVLAHGGGPEIKDMLGRVGIPSKFVNGLRYTDDETMEIVQMVLAGKLNKDLTAIINHCGGKALGFCGIDGSMIQAVPLDVEGADYGGHVGDITKVDPKPVLDALDNGYIPVVTCIAIGENDGKSYNINADTAASALAVALGAESLLALTDIRGLLRDVNDPASLITTVHMNEIDALTSEGIISGGMIPKVQACADAVNGGVKKAVMIDGRIPHSILLEMFSDEGIGTMFTE